MPGEHRQPSCCSFVEFGCPWGGRSARCEGCGSSSARASRRHSPRRSQRRRCAHCLRSVVVLNRRCRSGWGCGLCPFGPHCPNALSRSAGQPNRPPCLCSDAFVLVGRPRALPTEPPPLCRGQMYPSSGVGNSLGDSARQIRTSTSGCPRACMYALGPLHTNIPDLHLAGRRCSFTMGISCTNLPDRIETTRSSL